MAESWERARLWADVQPDNGRHEVCVKTASWTELDFLFLTSLKFTYWRRNSIWAGGFIRAVRKCDTEIESYETERERFCLWGS